MQRAKCLGMLTGGFPRPWRRCNELTSGHFQRQLRQPEADSPSRGGVGMAHLTSRLTASGRQHWWTSWAPSSDEPHPGQPIRCDRGGEAQAPGDLRCRRQRLSAGRVDGPLPDRPVPVRQRAAGLGPLTRRVRLASPPVRGGRNPMSAGTNVTRCCLASLGAPYRPCGCRSPKFEESFCQGGGDEGIRA